jgi:hypothetical protein
LGWLNNFLKRLATASKKQFGDEVPDCCKPPKKKPPVKPAGK